MLTKLTEESPEYYSMAYLAKKNGEGVDAWCDWLRRNVRQWNGA